MNTFQAQFSKQADEFMSAARDVRVPESVQAFAEDSIERTRDAYSKLTSVTKEAATVITEVTDLAQVNVKTLGDRMLANTLSNTDAVFDAARDIARSRSLQEAMKIQSEFFQSQMVKLGEQTREFFELSTALAMKTVDTKPMANATSKMYRKTKV